MNAKSLVFLIPLLMLLGMATTVAALETRRTPDWQTALNQYLREQTTAPHNLEHVVRARHPAQFTPDMGYPVSNDWRWAIERLPHPPQALYCVLLRSPAAFGPEDDAEGSIQHQVVYVGYLTDTLYRVGWIVYVGPRAPFPAELPTHLAALGCDLAIPTR